MKILLPPGWPRPRGYSNGVAVKGSMVFVAGMIGWVVTTWIRVRYGYPLEGSWGQTLKPAVTNEQVERMRLLTQENAQLAAELGALLCRLQQLIADPQAGKSLLYIQALQFGNVRRLDHRMAGGEFDLGKTNEMAIRLSHHQRDIGLRHQFGDGLRRKGLQRFIGNRTANALRRVGIKEHLHTQHANAQGVLGNGITKSDFRAVGSRH